METDLGPLFVDAFRGGVVLDWDECLEWLVELSELEASEIEPMMAPARPREVITRMLNNLKVLHVKHGEWEMAHQVQKRLTALLPGRFDQHRDLGLIAFKARHYGLAVQLLEDCLRTCEGSERSVLTRHWQEAVRCLSERN
jgi:regulator of sirC expression with transglutaminase-like and TPR domain